MVTETELHNLGRSIALNHNTDLVQLAIFKHLTTTLLKRYSDAYKVNIQQQLELVHLCVSSYLNEIGHQHADVQHALNAVVQAGQTSLYLASLPD
jgi:hypothetical protein